MILEDVGCGVGRRRRRLKSIDLKQQHQGTTFVSDASQGKPSQVPPENIFLFIIMIIPSDRTRSCRGGLPPPGSSQSQGTSFVDYHPGPDRIEMPCIYPGTQSNPRSSRSLALCMPMRPESPAGIAPVRAVMTMQSTA